MSPAGFSSLTWLHFTKKNSSVLINNGEHESLADESLNAAPLNKSPGALNKLAAEYYARDALTPEAKYSCIMCPFRNTACFNNKGCLFLSTRRMSLCAPCADPVVRLFEIFLFMGPLL